MQQMLLRSYEAMIPLAIGQRLKLDDAMLRATAKILQLDVERGISEAEVILEATEFDAVKAAKMILDSKIPEGVSFDFIG